MRIPSGGSVVAVSWIRAFSQACLLGWGDITDSSPGHFRRLVGASLLERCPSDRAMVAATRLLASVSGLVTPRSARRWTAWYASACDPDSSIGQEVRRGVTPAMLARARSRSQALGEPEADSPRLPKSGTLRAEHPSPGEPRRPHAWVRSRCARLEELGDQKGGLEDRAVGSGKKFSASYGSFFGLKRTRPMPLARLRMSAV